MNNKFKPVVAFDVDGVLRVSKIDNFEDPTLFSEKITMYKDDYPDIYHGAPKWDENGEAARLNHFSIVGRDFLQALLREDKTTPVWATTWQRWANTYFASVLEIPNLPVAVKTLFPEGLNYHHCSPAWKADQLSRQFDGRPLIWIDDNMTDRPGEDLVELRRPVDQALTLVYEINPYTGITEYDVEAINHWIQLASTPEGQSELRENRREKLKKERLQLEKWKRQRENENKAREIVFEKLEEMYPNQDFFNRSLSLAAKYPQFDETSVSSIMKRHNINGDAKELFEKIRIPRYHVERERSDENDSKYDF